MDPTTSQMRAGDSRSSGAVARQADAGLERLLAVLLRERCAMAAELRVQPCNSARQVIAQERLLSALEAYTTALELRGLSAPPKLRDELALQRGLASHRGGSRRQ